MGDDPSVPRGKLSRFALLATAGARTGLSLLTKSGSQATAERTALVLGRMRGLAAKVGQIASYVDGVLPEANRETYEAAFAKLRDQAMRSSFEDVRRVIEGDLGAPLGELFASFEEQPFASASIGQVHRATRHDGREVAVKVQHVGIAEAVEADLSNASVLEPLASLAGGGKVDSKQVFAEMRERLREELDYALEAERQRAFREIHADDPHVHVPEVHDDRCGPRVLTAEFVRGASLDEIAREATEDARRAYAETMWRFVFKGNLVGGMFNADPTPATTSFATTAS
jgi:predicted unusual protein kinase regulating ubiquinone biosynthesis (AarF/ABC1/UbiB family)